MTANGNAGEGDVAFGGAATAFGTTTLQAARDVSVPGAINTGGTTIITAARNLTTADVNSAGDLTMTASTGIPAAEHKRAVGGGQHRGRQQPDAELW